MLAGAGAGVALGRLHAAALGLGVGVAVAGGGVAVGLAAAVAPAPALLQAVGQRALLLRLLQPPGLLRLGGQLGVHGRDRAQLAAVAPVEGRYGLAGQPLDVAQ